MKKILIATFLIISCANISAQPPQGGMGGGRPQGGRPPIHRQPGNGGQGDAEIGIMKLPDIPGLTQDQREKLVKALTDERKDVMKLMDEKHQLMVKAESTVTEPSQKEIEKQAKKIAKIDIKIEKAKDKSSNKINSILTPDQYLAFTEKREQIEFSERKRMGNRPPRGEWDEHRTLPEGDMPPGMPMDNEF